MPVILSLAPEAAPRHTVRRRRPHGRTALFLSALAVTSCTNPSPEWHAADGHRWRDLEVPRRGAPGFTALAPRHTAITHENRVSESQTLINRHLTHGSGVALGDVDGDGLLDIYLGRIDGPNTLYRNLGGWKFADITATAGVGVPDHPSTGVGLADVDGDGDLDLLVNVLGGPNLLFRNDGMGRFTEDSTFVGRGSRLGSTTSTLADIDGDGDLDLYVANYKVRTVEDSLPPDQRLFDDVVVKVGDRWEITPPFRDIYRVQVRPELDLVARIERADPDWLYLNDGAGGFETVDLLSRLRDEHGRALESLPDYFGLTARFHDVDGDGDPDLYISNDFEDPDQFYLNDGSGYFRAVSNRALRNTSNSNMAVDFSDVDRDGTVDFFQVDMLARDLDRVKTQRVAATLFPKLPGTIDDRPQYQRNRLLLGRGDGTWAQVAEYGGVAASDWSWGVVFADIDLDGYEDLFITTGHVWDLMDHDAQELIRRQATATNWRRTRLIHPSLAIPNVVFRNRGGGRFEEVGAAWGVTGADIAHGVATGDLDGDGDLDVVVNRLGAPAAVYRNEATAPRVLVRLKGQAPNTAGIGAQLTLTGGPVEQTKEVTAGGLYLSSAAPEVSFATGTASALRLTVRWRSGRVQVLADVRPNRLYEVHEPAAPAAPAVASVPAVPASPAVFTDVTAWLDHRHPETAFDDYRRQPLLPNTLAQDGPGASWLALAGDTALTLLVPSGAGGRLAAYRYTGTRFAAVALPPALTAPARDGDQTMVLQAGEQLLLAQQNYEAPTAAQGRAVAQVVQVSLRSGARTVVHTGEPSSVGPLALADIDGDGDLDLFVGGRVLPAAYPLAPRSFLYRQSPTGWQRDTLIQALLDTVGLVSAAVFSDLDQDGAPDLVLATEWGPVRVLRNTGGGRFSETTAQVGLAAHRSRWRGIATGDLDEDGQLELLATSWGENTTRQPTAATPWLLFYGDFDRSGSLDLLEAVRAPRGFVPLLESHRRLHQALPFTRMRVPTATAYATATLAEVLGATLDTTQRVAVTTLTHTRFVPQPDGTYQPVALPPVAQWAPASAIVAADVTGDGHLDLVLSQNFFPTELATPRYDAGRGLLLVGDGTGAVTPHPHSGLAAYGDQRALAVADFDQDGRLDLVLTQNAQRTTVWRNTTARPGLRVRLVGPPANPTALGTTLRFATPTGPVGPRYEQQAGSGYWASHSPHLVLGRPAAATHLSVRWPDGTTATVALPPAPAPGALTLRWTP